jgi:hypothetical protein
VAIARNILKVLHKFLHKVDFRNAPMWRNGYTQRTYKSKKSDFCTLHFVSLGDVVRLVKSRF